MKEFSVLFTSVLPVLIVLEFWVKNSNGSTTSLKVSFLASTSGIKGKSKYFAGAFFTALDYINNNKSILQGHRLDYLFNDTRANSIDAINIMTSQLGNDTIGFIGPDEMCQCEATVAAAWNLPMIGYKCHDSKTGDPDESLTRRTFARTQPSTAKVSKSIISILQYYEWKRLTLVVGASSIWNETAESLMDLMKDNNILLHRVLYFREPYTPDSEMYRIVDTSHKETRIYVFLGDHHGLIDFSRLLKAFLEDRISEYVVIAVDERLYTEDPVSYLLKTPFETDLTPFNIKPFETVLLLVPRPPLNTQWEEFLNDVRQRNSEPPINGLKGSYKGFSIQVPIYAAYLYDAVHTYALALHQHLQEGGDVRNGTAIVSNIRNKTYTSILGYEVYVDRQGDAEGNYTLLTFNVHGQKGNVELQPAGNFRMTQGGVGIPELNLFREIKWKNGEHPLDEPRCGFKGEKCIQESVTLQIVLLCIGVVTLCGIIGVFLLRHYLYEQKLAKLLWKVDFKDIAPLVDSPDDAFMPPILKKHKRSKGHPFKNIFSFENESEKTNLLAESKHERSTGSDTFKKCLVGTYRGTVVSIKHVTKKNVEIDRDLKKQLQLRKELNHDNIARFIGACVETPHVYILTQFCQRGSLQDILLNEDFSLDEMFISSLVSDLIKAMVFIHESEISFHGNLKSSNCLVDSRWVLMVSDFGLHKLVNERSGSGTDLNKYFQKLLWRAPELLGSSSRDTVGSQKGDVYAFAFILYEMLGRKGPWGDCEISNKEIIEMLKTDNPSFRPDVSALPCESNVIECIKDCWTTDPDQRPHLKDIKGRLKNMLQGVKSNIFDNMLDMMEKYANNLESLVAERTELLSEEKKMTENLLLRMLPRFVAEKLKKGEPVAPEMYDSVSIYFSDIVGFTSLSAESTPMEVVCMLNDLYTCFDATVENYDVYKIETIGDAYFVVSGLPLRNEDLHAGEIASMSLHMLREIKNFKIRHRPNDTLKLRIGIHSGPCVAGVVGLKMPRYTLFGDTVNTASRMESTGVPLKIHCSETITALLQKLGGYHLIERGVITAKGKGEMLTYFLDGENATHRERRISHSKFSRTNSQNVDRNSNGDIFGSHIIHPKYWPNASGNSTSDLYLSPVQSSCDSDSVRENITSEEKISDMFEEVFDSRLHTDQKGMQISGSTKHPRALNSTYGSNNPFQLTNCRQTVQLERPYSVSELPRNGAEVFENVPMKPQIQRNMSVPNHTMQAEESV
ncbi:guanylate cyclase 32E-like [Mya arenaria]|uniref:guanylate cyclase 32E-like n=1 Tax=Mya arenaria TaxID=6604 RepID=UPI0022DF4B84|nr:guanylate cyclase 32E-like [Mya arenaria]